MFSFAGKMNRKHFFLYSLLNLFIFILFFILPAYINNKGVERGSSFLIILGGILSLCVIPACIALTIRQTALLTRRLRHIGKNPDYAVYITVLYGVVGAMSLSESLSTIAGLLFLLLIVLYFVFFFIPGKHKEGVKNGEAKPNIDVHSESESDRTDNTDKN